MTQYAKWLLDDQVIRGITVIRKGEIRKIIGKEGDLYMLEGRTPKGSYGWTKKQNIEIIEQEMNDHE